MVQVRRVVIVAIVFGVLLLPAQAAAGGWWSFINVDRSRVAIGETVEVRATEVLFDTVAEAKQAQREDDYFVYLVRGFDRSVLEKAMMKAEPGDWWSVGDAELVRVGGVDLGRTTDANLVVVRASFRVPDIDPGTYALMLCDAGCVHPLADVVPTTGFTVVADPMTARLARRVGRVEQRLARAQLRRLDERVLVARAESAAVRSELEELRAETAVLRRQARESKTPPWIFAGWLVAGIAVAGAAVLLLRRRRTLEPSHDVLDPWYVTDEELKEILSAGRRSE